VLDTRELARRPGTQRTVQRTVPAPEQLGIEILAVPTGSDIALDLRLEAVMEGVLVSGTAEVTLTGECGVRLADDPDHAHELTIDPRWESLRGLAGG